MDVFGGLEVSVAGSALPLLSVKSGGLLALLVLARGRTVPSGELVEWLWGEDAAPSAGNQLQRMVGQLRRQFEPELPARSVGSVILSAPDGYLLADTVDSDLFEVDRRLSDPEPRSEWADHGALLRIVNRRLLSGLESLLADHPWFVAVERQCAGIAIDALESGARSGEDYRELVNLVEVLAVRFPFEERLQAALVRGLGGVGRRLEAMALYERVRASLRDELGVDPGPDLQAAHRDILTLDHQPAGTSTAPAQLPRVVGGLVARPEAQRQLDRVAESDGTDAVVVTVIGGMGGIGKTALAVAWAHQLVPRFPDGQLYLNLRGFDADGDVMTTEDALSSLLTTLRAPDRDQPGVEAKSSLLRSCLAGRRYLLLLDNARDVDQVRPLLPGDAGSLAIITSRDRLSSLVTREGAVPIHLDRMGDEEAEQLLARRLGTTAVRHDPAAMATVLRACDGLPLALALVATRIAIEPRLTLTDIADELEGIDLTSWSVGVGSEDLRSVFAWSFASLSPETVETFKVIGAHPAQRMSTASLVSLIGLAPVPSLLALRELCDASLLQQVDREHFVLHDLLRAYARAMPDPDGRLPPAERRLIEHFVHTARAARDTQGSTHAHPIAALSDGVVPEVFAGATAGDSWCAAEYEAISAVIGLAVGRGWHRDAANITLDMPRQVIGGPSLAQVSTRLWEIVTASDGLNTDDALGDPALLADVLRTIASRSLKSGSDEQALSLLGRAANLAAASGDRLMQAQVSRGTALLHVSRKDYPAALQAFQQALDLAELEGSDATRVQLLISMGVVHYSMGDWQSMLESHDRAIEIEMKSRTQGRRLIMAHSNRAECLIALGRPREALEALEACRAAGSDISTDHTSILALRAVAAHDVGDLALARASVDEFRQCLLDQDPDQVGAEWTGGTQDLIDRVDKVDQALSRVP